LIRSVLLFPWCPSFVAPFPPFLRISFFLFHRSFSPPRQQALTKKWRWLFSRCLIFLCVSFFLLLPFFLFLFPPFLPFFSCSRRSFFPNQGNDLSFFMKDPPPPFLVLHTFFFFITPLSPLINLSPRCRNFLSFLSLSGVERKSLLLFTGQRVEPHRAGRR